MRDYKPIIVLFVICLVVSAALSGTYQLTKETIAQAAQEKINAQIGELIPEGTPGELQENNGLPYYQLTDEGGADLGRVYLVKTNGYGGELQIMVGLKDVNTVVGVRILSSSETPGLGKRAEEPTFYEQYQGISTDSFNVVKGSKTADNDIVAISSATITSKAVTKAVNLALTDYLGKEADGQ